MKNSMCTMLAVLLLGAASGFAHAQHKGDLQLEKPWARATPPGASVGGGYLVIRNKGAAGDRLVGASSPAAARMEIHEMAMEKDVMRMREVKGLDVPAKGAVELKPGGFHLMFMELKAPLKAGDKVPVTLRFEKAGEVKSEFAVEAMGAGAGHAAKHGTGKHDAHGSMKH
jgi:copper(I)-binding protein